VRDIAGRAARVAVERCGKPPRYNEPRGKLAYAKAKHGHSPDSY
jgi:hypothetical protein